MKHHFIHCFILILSLGATCHAEAVDADLLLIGGTIVDGSGRQPFEGNVAVRGDRILAVGEFEVGRVGRTLDCTGMIVAPGFIDLHTHSDDMVEEMSRRKAVNYLMQGCTTMVTGNCGGGAGDVAKFYELVQRDGAGTNVAHLIPQGAIREQVMGLVRRRPTAAEQKKMLALVEAGMQAGAWGMSTGLQYVPSAYADLDELVAIASVVSSQGGIYASHIRDEGDQLLDSIEETLEIAQRANVPVHISHFKASKKANWGKVRAAAKRIEIARAEGLRVTADQYPYDASSTSIAAMLLPDVEREGGDEAMVARLNSDEHGKRLAKIVQESLIARGRIMIASFESHPDWVGRMIREVAEDESRAPLEIALEILRGGGVQGVSFSMDENDVRYVMTLPWVATASDGKARIDDGTQPHPRSFGTFPRKIGHYCLQEKVLPLAQAVRSASGLPADILGMKDRGYVRKGLVADVVVFDPQVFRDRSTFAEPYHLAVGMRWVLVNGQLAVAEGEPQEVLAGRALRKPK